MVIYIQPGLLLAILGVMSTKFCGASVFSGKTPAITHGITH